MTRRGRAHWADGWREIGPGGQRFDSTILNKTCLLVSFSGALDKQTNKQIDLETSITLVFKTITSSLGDIKTLILNKRKQKGDGLESRLADESGHSQYLNPCP